jgi:hypothetical protein
MATDLKGLESFRNKLQRYSNINASLTNQVSEEIAKRGEQIAREEYAGLSKVNVTHEPMGSGMSRVVAEKDGLAYIEFGTGRVGQQSNYPTEKLPQSGVPITGNWEYYYPSEHKVTKDGEEGWMLGSSFVKGQSAGMQMYRTSQRLRNEMANIVKNKIKGDGNV